MVVPCAMSSLCSTLPFILIQNVPSFCLRVNEKKDRNTGAHVTLACNAPIDVVNYPVRPVETEKIKLDLDYDFNYLAISQWGPRKNIEETTNVIITEVKYPI